MSCYCPLEAYWSKGVNVNGNRYLVFNKKDAAQPDDVLRIPCGRCIGCRLARSAEWAVRCVHESKLYSHNCFITLTYSPEFLPSDGSLIKKDFQDFMKLLRYYHSGIDAVVGDTGKISYPIRYFMCGEYGDKSSRPHYHACLFNFDFPDKELWKTSFSGDKLYTSEILNKIWGKGYCVIGDVTFDSAAYVARYIMKKINGADAEDHYTNYDDVTGEVLSVLVPEYTNCSLGIGKAFIEKFTSDVFPRDYCVIGDHKFPVPKYYMSWLKKTDICMFEDIKEKRLDFMRSVPQDDDRRLFDRWKVKQAQIKLLERNYDND